MKTICVTLLLGTVALLMVVAPGHSTCVPGTKLSCHGTGEVCQRSIDAIPCCDKSLTCQPMDPTNSDGNYNGRCVPRPDLANTYTGICHPKYEPCRPGQTTPEMCCKDKDNLGNSRACPPALQGFIYSQCPEM